MQKRSRDESRLRRHGCYLWEPTLWELAAVGAQSYTCTTHSPIGCELRSMPPATRYEESGFKF